MDAELEVTAKNRLKTASTGSVLVVDDDDDTRLLVLRALEEGQIPCSGASSGEDAMAQVMVNPSAIDTVLLDVALPGMDGLEVLRLLKLSPATAHIHVIMVTGTATLDSDIIRGVDAGAAGYLSKPCSPSVLLAKVRFIRKQVGGERKLRDQLRVVSLQAMTDPLTGLYNRLNFEARILEAEAHARRSDSPFSVLLLDLDHFKTINDTHGHGDGDRVLVHFANTIHAVMRADDVAFRYGGDEFVLLLPACTATRAVEVAKRLRRWLGSSPFRFADGSDHIIAFSAGAAASRSEEGYSGVGLVARADVALYRAKAAGGNRVEH
jgi:two-component system cell cycle response regulator